MQRLEITIIMENLLRTVTAVAARFASYSQRGIIRLQIKHVLHGTYVHNHLDDIAHSSLPTSVRENSDLHSVHVLCARGGRRTVRGTCWGLSCTASSIAEREHTSQRCAERGAPACSPGPNRSG
jgi:hypothetical protein